jgi:hypothetical protein
MLKFFLPAAQYSFLGNFVTEFKYNPNKHNLAWPPKRGSSFIHTKNYFTETKRNVIFQETNRNDIFFGTETK